MTVTPAPVSLPRMPATTASSGRAAAGGSGDLVLVLNSGSSSVKFALLLPGTGERLMGGIGERLGTPEAVLRVQWFPAPGAQGRLSRGHSPRGGGPGAGSPGRGRAFRCRAAGGRSPGGARRRAVHLLGPGR